MLWEQGRQSSREHELSDIRARPYEQFWTEAGPEAFSA